MEKTFEVTREDNCIWIKDLRIPEELNQQAAVKHITPQQARELVDALDAVGMDVAEYATA